MRTRLKILIASVLLTLFSQFAFSQAQPAGLPITKSKGWIEYGYLQNDSGRIDAKRDTGWTPRFAGTSVYWQNAGVDTFFWTFNGKTGANDLKWDRQGALFMNGGTVGDSLLMNPEPTVYLFKNLVNGTGVAFDLSDTTITISAASYTDGTVDFSVNTNPNTGGTTFNPNTPQLTTVIYVSTIDGSQWTWNGSVYVLYVAPYWAKTGNAGTSVTTNFIGTTDNIGLKFRVNNTESGYINIIRSNTSFGQSTLISNGTGTFNNAFGYFSLSTNSTGVRNNAFGYQALKANLNGADNIAIGHNALTANTSGIQNIAIGSSALLTQTTGGNNNVAIGFESQRLMTGQNNTAIGYRTLYNNSTGTNNVSIGVQSLLNNTGSHNTAVGMNTFQVGSGAASYNTAIGEGALTNTFSGDSIVAIGFQAGYSNTTGDNNAFIGYQAGFSNTTASNQMFFNTLKRASYSADQNESPIYIQQSGTVSAQLITLNGKTGLNTIAPGTSLQIAETALGVTPDNAKGLFLVNSTAAAAGAQQISPAIHWQGQGWKTNATAASQSVDFREYVLPVQGAANPTGQLIYQFSVNGGAYSSIFGIGSAGQLLLGGTNAGVANQTLVSGGPNAAATWANAFALTNGNGTTANSTAVDWGGGLTSSVNVNTKSAGHTIFFGQSSYTSTSVLGIAANNGETHSTVLSVGGKMKEFFNTIRNDADTETDLYSYTIAADVLDTDGMSIKADYGGTFANVAGKRRIRLYFGGTGGVLIFDSQELEMVSSGSWTLSVQFTRSSSSTLKCQSTFIAPGLATTSVVYVNELNSLDFTAGNVLLLTGMSTNASADDLYALIGNIYFYPQSQ
jgi:hypothetical protein